MNRLTKKQFTRIAVCAIATLAITACSSEEVTPQDKQQQKTEKAVATFTGSQPNNDSDVPTRTTATYTLGNSAKVFWQASDKVFVKDDAGVYHQSNAANIYDSNNKTRAIFNFNSGTYTLDNRDVHYTGLNGTDANTVTIAKEQKQVNANDFSHLGKSGDCGVAKAQGSNGNYKFTLQHKASYLCFVPRCMNTALGPNINLKKITVKANQPIAGKYDFTNGTLVQKAGETYSNTITLETGNFSLNTTTADVTKNGAYMVIAPGTYDFTITYTIKDPTTNVEVDIVKTVDNYDCYEGKINDITAWIDKDINDYSKQHYMWDAVDYYWKGHEEDAPKVAYTAPAHPTYPQGPSDSRWYNTASFPAQATRSSKDLPNANAMTWYAKYGDMHWDTSIFWSLNGHLYRGGVWVKTRAKLTSEGHYSTTITADGDADLRTHTTFYNVQYSHPSNGRPTNYATDYFYWPATSFYEPLTTSSFPGANIRNKGGLIEPSVHCYMWSSTVAKTFYAKPSAYYLDFQSATHLAHMFIGDKDDAFPSDPTIFK